MTQIVERVRAAPWRFFDVEVSAVTRLSPTFVRLTVTGHDLDKFVDLGYDARVKLVLPSASDGYASLPRGTDWFQRWRDLGANDRPPLRTYTTRAVRPDRREVDIDLALHADTGLAARWVQNASLRDPVVLLGPDSESRGPHGGVEFVLPKSEEALVMAGDETAMPAITNILSQLPNTAHGTALLEVPDPRDWDDVTAPPGIVVVWLARKNRPHGELLLSALRHYTPGSPLPTDLQSGSLPQRKKCHRSAEQGSTRAWLAGEAASVREMRQYLVHECGVPRDQVTFMAYWKQGVIGG